jgi:hypothetical protein
MTQPIEKAAEQLSEWFESVTRILDQTVIPDEMQQSNNPALPNYPPVLRANILAASKRELEKATFPYTESIYKPTTLALFSIATYTAKRRSYKDWGEALAGYKKLRDQLAGSETIKSLTGEASQVYFDALIQPMALFLEKPVPIEPDKRGFDLDLVWNWGTRFMVAAADEWISKHPKTIVNPAQKKDFPWIGLTVQQGLK